MIKETKKLIVYSIVSSCLLLNSVTAQSQPNRINDASLLNKEILKIIKKNSLFTDRLDWKSLKVQSDTLTFTDDDLKNEKIILDFYINKLRAVGDKHSFFISSYNILKISNVPIAAMPEGEYLGDGIGWIKVPGLMTFSNNKDIDFANSIRNIIEKIDTQNVITGWIVDLRHNGGGNMWPMLAGLNALVEDGIAGYFIQGNKRIPWISKNGKIVGKDQPINTYKIKNYKVKIAVLIDSQTGSSGEMAAVSLLGLTNVKSFGQTTSGYITANYSYILSSGSQLLLAKTYVSDRTGKIYKEAIVPDCIVDDLSNTKDDEVVKSASKWIRESIDF